MPRWLIRLKGERFDLEDLEKELTCPSVRVFERGGYYYLWSQEVDESFETAEQVYDYAEDKLIPAINGIMRVRYPDFRNVEVDAIGEKKEGGSTAHSVFVRVRVDTARRVRCRASVTVVKADGTVVYDSSESIPAKGSQWLEVLLRDKWCLGAFCQFGTKPNDWVTLYKIYEIVESDGAPITNWVSKKQVERFTRTANSFEAIGLDNARHGKYIPPPSKPMSVQEATRLIGIILERWVEWKTSSK